MDREPSLTPQTALVLDAIVQSSGPCAGVDIARTSGLASGTLYPILLRLEKAGWLESRWEVPDGTDLGRPRRRYYELTQHGSTAARESARRALKSFQRLAAIGA